MTDELDALEKIIGDFTEDDIRAGKLDAVARQLKKALPEPWINDKLFAWRCQKVRELPVSTEGFGHFHWAMSGKELSPYAKYLWVPELVNAYNHKTGVLLDCHRAAGKSFLLTLWVAYVTGKNPVGSAQLVRINADAAKETDLTLANMIETNTGWKMCFSHVVPDRSKWGAEGRNLLDTNVTGVPPTDGYEQWARGEGYGEWTKRTFSDHGSEFSLLCTSITSGNIIGKHPSNGQYFDDLHDEKNTRSAREMQEIVDIVQKNILPTWTRPDGRPTLVVACTLWSEKDAYHAFLQTGIFKHIQTPMFVLADHPFIKVDGKEIPVTWIADTPIEEDLQGRKIKSLWYKAYPAEVIRSIQRMQPVYFDLMYLCDLSSMKGRVLKREWLHEYPAEKLNSMWPRYFGIDFASTEDNLKGKDTDYFALAVVCGLPGGGAVLENVFREHLPFREAVDRTKAIASMYPSLQLIGVEKWGEGRAFFSQLLYSTNLPVAPFPQKGTPIPKGLRYQEGLAQMCTTSRAWISDLSTPGLQNLIDEWISWDGKRTATGHDDCLDAWYYSLMAAQGHLMPRSSEDDMNFSQKIKRPSPFAALAK